ncbi:MAG: AI-2E family transporter [Phycisphaeraceae bacterium]|nr:AI-2E family transporter [Phycisphaeraceae bacterium]
MSDTDPAPSDSKQAPRIPSRLMDRHLWQIQPVRDALVVLLVIAVLWLGNKLSVVTVPLLLAIMLAYLFEPVIQAMMRWLKIKRTAASTAIVALAAALIVAPAVIGAVYGVIQGVALVSRMAENTGLVYSSVVSEVEARQAEASLRDAHEREARAAASAAEETPGAEGSERPEGPGPEGSDAAGTGAERPPPDPEFLRRLAEEAEQKRTDADEARGALSGRSKRAWLWIHNWIVERDEGALVQALDNLQGWVQKNAAALANRAAAAGASAIGTSLRILGGVASLGFMLFLTAFFFFFVSTSWVEFKGFGGRVIPERHRALILDLLQKFDRVISGFIRGRLTIAFILSIVFTIGYWIIGVPAAFILGPVVALLAIVPYLSLIGVPISILLLWLEGHGGFRGEWWWIVFAPTVFYFAAQSLDDYFLTPRIQGKVTDMSTPAIVFAAVAGGALMGFFGVLIAIPLAACIKILIREIFWPRFKAWGEGKEKDFLPIGRA